MKKLLTLIASALLLAIPAHAYDGESITVPTVAAGATSNAIAQVIFVGNQNTLSIQWATSGTNVTASFSGSVDGSTFDTNRFVFLVEDANTVVTNMNTAGLGYVRLDRVVCVGTINATNTVKYGEKPGL